MPLFTGFFLSFFITLIASFITKQITSGNRIQNKAKEIAIARGHVVTATWQKTYAGSMEKKEYSTARSQSAVFTYEYKGRTYKYRCTGNYPPYQLTLYFIKNPKKAAAEGEISYPEIPWVSLFIILGLMLSVAAVF